MGLAVTLTMVSTHPSIVTIWSSSNLIRIVWEYKKSIGSNTKVKDLIKRAHSKVKDEGSSTLVVLYKVPNLNQFRIANIGDSQCVIYRFDKTAK